MARNTLLSRLLLLAVLAVLAPLTAAQLSIYTGSDKYKYQGCYNETNDLPNTAHERALSGGASKVMEGNMTVPLCLSFCSTGADKQYNYAGVEYSRCVPLHPPPFFSSPSFYTAGWSFILFVQDEKRTDDLNV